MLFTPVIFVVMLVFVMALLVMFVIVQVGAISYARRGLATWYATCSSSQNRRARALVPTITETRTSP